MRTKYVILACLMALFVVSCDTTSTVTLTSRTAVTSFYLISKYSTDVKSYVFTIDTISHEIYNEDSLDFGTRVDSLAPVMYPIFAYAVIADSISLYAADTVYVDFTEPQRMKVTSSTGDTATYTITVNVHKVDPDSFIWRKGFDLGDEDIERQGAVKTESGEIFWLVRRGGAYEMYSSMDGMSWGEESVEGLPFNLDVEHLAERGDGFCAMCGNDLWSFDGMSWSKMKTKTEIEIRHLLMSFKGELYALGVGNVILKLKGNRWTTAAQMESGFPVRGESAFVGWTVGSTNMAYIAFGIDENGNYLRDVWSSENGSYWVKLTEKENTLTPRAYAMARQYGRGILLIGGENPDSVFDDRFMFSKDYGMTWEKCDTLYNIDTTLVYDYGSRYRGAMVVNEYTGWVYVMGGKRDKRGKKAPLSRESNDVWRGLHYADIPGFEK